MESYTPPAKDEEVSLVYTPFTFSAISEKALTALVSSYAQFLREKTSVELRALSHTLIHRRTAFPYRVALSARDQTSLCERLDQFLEGQGTKLIIPVPCGSTFRILGVFTGQGAQWAGMMSKMIDSPAVAQIVDDLDRSLGQLPDPPDWSLKAELLADKSTSRIVQAAISQPTCTAVQIIAVELLRAAGIEFAAVVGHSSGEIGAAYAAGYLSASDAIRIAYYRGVHLSLAQGRKGESGAMIAIGTSYDDAKSFCNLRKYRGKICVAASNSATSVTLSGDANAIESVGTVFSEEKKFARVLKVDKACMHHVLAAAFADQKADKSTLRSLTPYDCLFCRVHGLAPSLRYQSSPSKCFAMSVGLQCVSRGHCRCK